jgi:hypothetical protein
LGVGAYAASVAAFASQSVTLGIALLGAAQVGFLASLWRRRRARAGEPAAYPWSSAPPAEPWELATPRVSVVRLSALGWPSDAPGSEFNLN